MFKKINLFLAVFLLMSLSVNAADMRYQYNEPATGANHPTKPDSINRLTLVEHNNDGTHNIPASHVYLDLITKGPWVDARAYGVKCDGVTDDTAALNNAFAAAASATKNGELYIPSTGKPCLVSSTLVWTPSNSGWVRIRGSNQDNGLGTILRFSNAGDGLQLNGNSTVEDINIQTTNASGGIGLRFSGLNQLIKNVHISRSGSGVWAIGIQNYGAVTSALHNPYVESNAATVGIEAVPNGANAVGSFSLFSPEIRGVTTCFHIGGSPAALDVNIFGGAIESCGTNGILADGGSPVVSLYGTQFETNGTNDISWVTGGTISLYNTVHPGGTTNILNCPNTTCTANIRMYGVIGNSTAAVTIGNSVGQSVLNGSKLKGGALTLGLPAAVTLLGNTSFDATLINDTLASNGLERFNILGGSGSYPVLFQNNTNGNFSFYHNGLAVWHSSGDGNLRLDQKIIAPTGAAGVAGTSTLVGGTVTVSTTAVTASSTILISRNTAGGTVGDLRLGAIVAGTSFVINSASGTDTSTVNWWLVN